MQRKEITSRLDGIIEFAEIDAYVDTPVKRYSSGMYVRLAFAVAAHLLPEILIVDEVLAVGDLAFQQKCLGKMKDVAEHGRTVLFVSHNMASVRALCTRGILLSDGRVELDGDVEEAVRAYLPTIVASSHTDLEAAEGRIGNGRARFTAVAFRNQSGTRANSFQIGDDILVDVVLRTREPLRTGVLKVGLYTSEGLQVTALNPQIDSGFDIGRLDGTAVIRAVFRDQRLYPGTYRLSLRLEDAGGEVLDSVPAAAAFQVAPGGPRVARQLGSGVVHLTPEWSRED